MIRNTGQTPPGHEAGFCCATCKPFFFLCFAGIPLIKSSSDCDWVSKLICKGLNRKYYGLCSSRSSCITRGGKKNPCKFVNGEIQSIIIIIIEYHVCTTDLLMKRREFSFERVTFGLVGS